mgnify:FL=1
MGLRPGQSEALGITILIAAVIVMAAAFMIYAMGNYGKSAASSALAQVEAFMTNVADDIEASMYMPGTVLVYPLPTSGYGSFNLLPGYCNVTIYTASGTILSYLSGALIYGIPPSLISYTPGLVKVIRGSGEYGGPGAFSTYVLNPSAPLISILQFGYSRVNFGQSTVSYGTYLIMFPRVLIVSGGNTTYVYLPIFSIIQSAQRNSLVVNISNISVVTMSGVSGLSLSNACGQFKGSVSASAQVLRLIVINITLTFR